MTHLMYQTQSHMFQSNGLIAAKQFLTETGFIHLKHGNNLVNLIAWLPAWQLHLNYTTGP